MATSYGSASADFDSHPWAYIAIPVAVVAGLSLLAVLIHTHRRKRLLKARLQYVGSNPGPRRALERDLQEAWMRGAPQEEGLRQQRRAAVMRWSRNANGGGRWAWARELLSARPEEGLNEFGDAPPPYDGRKGEGKIQEEGADAVEMDTRPSGSGTGSGSGTAGGSERQTVDLQAGRAPDQHGNGRSQQGLPPAYSGPTETTLPIAVPPPALMPGPHSSHPSA